MEFKVTQAELEDQLREVEVAAQVRWALQLRVQLAEREVLVYQILILDRRLFIQAVEVVLVRLLVVQVVQAAAVQGAFQVQMALQEL